MKKDRYIWNQHYQFADEYDDNSLSDSGINSVYIGRRSARTAKESTGPPPVFNNIYIFGISKRNSI